MIYLHFLDRELRESVDSNLSTADIKSILLIASLMSEKIYMAYSHFFETCKYDKELENIVLFLNKQNILECISSYKNYADFIDCHKAMYLHDKDRYPFYYEESTPAPKLTYKTSSTATTKALWSKMLMEKVFSDCVDSTMYEQFKNFVYTLGDKAVTKAAFKPFLEKVEPSKRKVLSKKLNLYISEEYTKKYLENNHLITGIDSLNYYDNLETSHHITDIRLYNCIFSCLSINVDYCLLEKLIANKTITCFKKRLNNIVTKIISYTILKNGNYNLQDVESLIKNIPFNIDECNDEYIKVFALDVFLSKYVGNVQICDCLLLCATDEEWGSIIKYDESKQYTMDSINLFRDNEIDYILMKTRIGMINASISATLALTMYSPKFIIMAGFCAGNKDSVHLGDIIIADKIYNYSTGKQVAKTEFQQEQEVISLGNNVSSIISAHMNELSFSTNLVLPMDFELQIWKMLSQLIKNDNKIDNYSKNEFPNIEEVVSFLKEKKYITVTNDDIKITSAGKTYYYEIKKNAYFQKEQYDPKILLGVMACGSYVQQQKNIFLDLQKRDRKTIAINMESYAVALAAERSNIPCIVVKGVGDFANEHKTFANRFIPFSTFNAFFIAKQIASILYRYIR